MAPLQDRFNAKVRVTPGCWPWVGGKSKSGYGCLKHQGKVLRAPRVSFELHTSAIPPGLHVLHRCDRPDCVNPDHLVLGTHLDNMRDMFAKHRRQAAKGERNGRAKLTVEQVAALRADARPVAVLAAVFGVSKRQVYNVRSAANWQQ